MAASLTVISVCAVATWIAGAQIVLNFSGLLCSAAFVFACVYCTWPLTARASRLHPAAVPVIVPIVYCGLGWLFFAFDRAINQPHPWFTVKEWSFNELNVAVLFFTFFAFTGLMATVLDEFCVRPKTADLLPLPDFGRLLGALSHRRGRLVLIIGFAPILAYYSLTVIEMWVTARISHGNTWPPPRVFLSCVYLWNLLWLVERSDRSERGGLPAVVALLTLILFVLPGSLDVVRE